MLKKNINLAVSFILFSIISMSLLATDDFSLYQDRGDRFEGIYTKDVSGGTIELLSALAYSEAIKTMPEKLMLRFYLKEDSNVSIQVRAVKTTPYDYRMTPNEKSWKMGFNDFEWATQEVIQQLVEPKLDKFPLDLGIVARSITTHSAATEETIFPVIFYNSNSSLPKKVKKYQFTLKTRNSAKLNWAIYKAQSSEKIDGPSTIKTDSSMPEPFSWTPKPNVVEGDYFLLVYGNENESTDTLRKKAYFYHKPNISITEIKPVPIPISKPESKLCVFNLDQLEFDKMDLIDLIDSLEKVNKCEGKVIKELQKKQTVNEMKK